VENEVTGGTKYFGDPASNHCSATAVANDKLRVHTI